MARLPTPYLQLLRLDMRGAQIERRSRQDRGLFRAADRCEPFRVVVFDPTMRNAYAIITLALSQ